MPSTKPNTSSEPGTLWNPAATAEAGPAVSVAPDEFKAAFRLHAGGVALITAEGDQGTVALTATSVVSVSPVPALLMFSISDLSSSAPAMLCASTVVIHLLSAGDLGLARLGAASGVDRFADRTMWSRLPTGEPYFLAPRSRIRGRVVARMSAGVSTVVLVEALDVVSSDPDDRDGDHLAALVYHNRTWHALGPQSML